MPTRTKKKKKAHLNKKEEMIRLYVSQLQAMKENIESKIMQFNIL